MGVLSAGPLADYEPLLTDNRVEQATAGLRSSYPDLLEDAEFVTFAQPAASIMRETDEGITVPLDVPEQAVFAILVPNPRAKGIKLMFTATTTLQGWYEADYEYRHYVGKTDPAVTLFRFIMPQLHQIVTNLREMI